jgi:hypothetical protein
MKSSTSTPAGTYTKLLQLVLYFKTFSNSLAFSDTSLRELVYTIIELMLRKLLIIPIGNWEECRSTNVFVNGTDNSPPSGLGVLSGVIERSKRTVIGHRVGLSSCIQMLH